jgi:glycosyltransferase involved in cell wall biosynthesis
MKVCVISTTIMTCPPIGYSGLEQLAWQQAVGLFNKNHSVTLIAPKGSEVPIGLNLIETKLGESERNAYKKYNESLKEYDIIIDNSWEKWSYISKIEEKIKIPILGVLHAPIDTMYNSAPPLEKPCFVSISRDQSFALREHLKCDSKVAYNGVDIDFYKPSYLKRNKRYLFLARMSTIKGPDIAISVAKNCKIGLDLVGDDIITGEPNLSKFIQEECIKSEFLKYVGNQNRSECVIWFNTNKCLLHPNKLYKEPFGLAPVEAQLCGMPVIAWDHGAMRETIKHGETGYIVNSQEEIEEIIKSDNVSSLNSDRCREWASQFSNTNMVNRYEELCKLAIETGGW